MSPSAPASERGYGRVGDDDTSPEERQAIYRKIHLERISETMPTPVPLPAETRQQRPLGARPTADVHRQIVKWRSN